MHYFYEKNNGHPFLRVNRQLQTDEFSFRHSKFNNLHLMN